jgi:hypothetical protein
MLSIKVAAVAVEDDADFFFYYFVQLRRYLKTVL